MWWVKIGITDSLQTFRNSSDQLLRVPTSNFAVRPREFHQKWSMGLQKMHVKINESIALMSLCLGTEYLICSASAPHFHNVICHPIGTSWKTNAVRYEVIFYSPSELLHEPCDSAYND